MKNNNSQPNQNKPPNSFNGPHNRPPNPLNQNKFMPNRPPGAMNMAPMKLYKAPKPTLKDCIHLNNLMPIMDNEKTIDAISSTLLKNDALLDEFLQKIDTRTKVCRDDPKGEFIISEHNRDGDSYRSPFSNKYFPPLSGAKYPCKELRELEELLNKMFKLYIKHYYSLTTIYSVYCWELGSSLANGYGVAVLIKNETSHEKKITAGIWDSTNLITVRFENDPSGKKKAKYSLITTVNLAMRFNSPICGAVGLSGTVTRNSHYTKLVTDYTKDENTVENIGVLVEDMENSIRNTLDTVYCLKSKQIIDTARYNPTQGKPGIVQANALKDVWKGNVPKI